MANYVHNYIFCGEDAKNYVLSPEAAFSEDLCGRYDPLVEPLGNDRFLVTFDTKGMKYRRSFIARFIEKYKDSVWYGIEENEIEQGEFFWNGSEVAFKKRDLVESLDKNDLEIKYSNLHYRPYITIFISVKEIVVEDFLHNRMARYRFHEDTSFRVEQYFKKLVASVPTDHLEYGVPYKNDIERQLFVYYEDKRLYVDSYRDDEDWQHFVDDGEPVLEQLLHFFEKILKYEAINEKIRFEVFNDFLV